MDEPLISKKVPSACQRCRRQKLKCDVQRPCTLCVRAKVECSTAESKVKWKAYGPGRPTKRTRKSRSTTDHSVAKRVRRAAPPEDDTVESHLSKDEVGADPPPGPSGVDMGRVSPRVRASHSPVADESSWNSTSAAINFMEEAFHQHDAPTLAGQETSALSVRPWMRQEVSHQAPSRSEPHFLTRGIHASAEAELLSILPSIEVATLLVDNYFDRIHWFMLVFHQSDFREGFEQLYDFISQTSTERIVRLGFLAVFAAVIVVSSQHVDCRQKDIAARHGVQLNNLQQELLTTLRLRILDIVSLGSIDAVQTCVLLGSFYLYHGDPQLAWPICGNGLRIAQALNLHRRQPSQTSQTPDLDDAIQRAEETRKRCWWAVYEIETFCSMLYGFPLSINDVDCDIELLNPYPLRSHHSAWTSKDWKKTGEATLLSYKYSMVTLSIIVKSALTELYGLRQGLHANHGSTEVNASRLQTMVTTVSSLDSRLQTWYQSLPRRLKIDDKRNAPSTDIHSTGPLGDEATQSDNAFEEHLFQLQALALKLAFENARILVHRPLLSYKMVVHPQASGGLNASQQTQLSDPFRVAVLACRDAALEISRVGTTPTFSKCADTYAVSFISLHLFTAAVALSIMTSQDPLSQESHESKLGMRRLMAIQAQLKTRSIVAEQGYMILKKLISLVVQKEMEKMLEVPEPYGEEAQDSGHLQRNELAVGDNTSETQANLGTALSLIDTSEGLQAGLDTNFLPSSEELDALSFDFYEDPTIAQALIDFEQVMNYPPSDQPDGVTFGAAGPEHAAGSCFGGQDQNWIWGQNLRL